MSYRVRSISRSVLIRDCAETANNAERGKAPMYMVGSDWVSFENRPLADATLQIEEGEAAKGTPYVPEIKIPRAGTAEPAKDSADDKGSFLERSVGKLKAAVKEDDDNKPKKRGRPRKVK